MKHAKHIWKVLLAVIILGTYAVAMDVKTIPSGGGGLSGTAGSEDDVVCWDASGELVSCQSGNLTFDGTTVQATVDGSSGAKYFSIIDDQASSEMFFFQNQSGNALIGTKNDSGLSGMALRGDSDRTFITHFAATAHIDVTATGAGNVRLASSSGEIDMQNPVQMDTSTLTVSSGAVTAVKSYHVINGEGASADTLDTISGGEQGDILWLERGDADITLDCDSGAAGNIRCGGGADIVLNDGEVIQFIFNSDSNWASPETS